MLRKLRIKFILITMVVVTVMLGAVLVTVYHTTKTDLESKSNQLLQHLADAPFQAGRPAPFAKDAQLPYFTVELGSRGEILSASGIYYDLPDREFVEQVVREAIGTDRKAGELPGFSLRFRKSSAPGKQFYVFVDTSGEQAMLGSLLASSGMIGLLCWLAFFGASILLAAWAVRPVEQAWQQQKQFVSDASHELKTPLTVIMTNAEMLQSGDNSQEDSAFLSENILTMSRQMQALVEQMLELARTDSVQSEIAPVDLSDLVETTDLLFEPVFFDRGMTLEMHIQPEITVAGNEAQLRQMLGVFLDNAQKYASPGGQTTVTLTKRGKSRCLLAVANQGPPIPPEQLRSLFKRFFRADAVRTRNGSFGLGLSIAQSIVQRHKGKIWVESRDGINSFFVELPIAAK